VKLKIGYATHKGLIRKNNEDNFLINQNINLYIVADGLGGHQSGEIASSLAIDIINEHFEDNFAKTQDTDYYEIFRNGYKKANEHILKRGYDLQQRQLMGTTATSLLFTENSYLLCHTGDSRAYLVRNETIKQITKDQTRLQEMIDEKSKNPDEIPNKELYGSILSFCLGFDEKLNIDFFEDTIVKKDFILLCSDGLSDYVDDEMIYQQFVLEKEPEKICKSLIKKALDKGGYDNITAVVLRFP